METDMLFSGMSWNQKEMTYKFEEFVVTITKEDVDKYKINVDPGSYDLYFSYFNSEFSEYMDLSFRIELNQGYKKNGFWFIRTTMDVSNGDFFKNGDVLSTDKINIILKNIKSSAEFIKNHDGTIRNKKQNEVYEIGKMKVTLISQSDNRVKIEIEGMKHEEELPHDYVCGNPRCYVKGLETAYIADNFKSLVWQNSNNIIRTREDAMKIIECLKECSKKLHDMNEPKKVEEVYSFGKMTLKVNSVENDVYTCLIKGMKEYNNLPSSYIEGRDKVCCSIMSYNRFMILNRYYKNFIFSQYTGDYDREYAPINNFKVTKGELNELKELLQICSNNLHKINHPKVEKEKLTIKVTPVETDKVILEITGMEDTMFHLGESFRNRIHPDKPAILIDNDKYITPEGCNNDTMWINIGKNNPMTWKAAEEIIAYLGASAAKLHAKNHEGKSYTLVL